MLEVKGTSNSRGSGSCPILMGARKKQYCTNVGGVFLSSSNTWVIYSCSVYRVNWIRAKSRSDRWQEELSLTQHEMLWVILWFQHRAEQWRSWAHSQSDHPNDSSMSCYAYRQAEIWETCKKSALVRFQQTSCNLLKVFGSEMIIINST